MRANVRVIAAAAVFSAATFAAPAQQAVQWKVSDGGNGHWYAADFVLRDWEVARTYAEDIGGHLATVHSAQENAFVLARRSDAAQDYWLGGRRFDSSCSPTAFEWVTGEPWTFTNWLAGDPNCVGWNGPNTGTVVEMIGRVATGSDLGKWNDESPTLYFGSKQIGAFSMIEWSADCNNDGIVDYGQILSGQLADADSDNVPDCCEAGTPCAINLVTNGSFELGVDQACGWICIGVGDTRLVGWDVVLNSVDRQRTEPGGCNEAWFASQGNYSVDLNGCSVGGIIRQQVSTQAGVTYRLSFDLTLNPTNVAVGRIRVRAGSVVREFEYLRRPTNPQPYEHHEFEFTAAGSGTVIEFESLNREYPGQWNGPVVDCIRVEESPCPGDVTGNSIIDGVDLAAILGAWGTNGQNQYDCDIDNDGVVSGTDLAYVLGGWGPCQ